MATKTIEVCDRCGRQGPELRRVIGSLSVADHPPDGAIELARVLCRRCAALVKKRWERMCL